jgi:hypothetical protein
VFNGIVTNPHYFDADPDPAVRFDAVFFATATGHFFVLTTVQHIRRSNDLLVMKSNTQKCT